MSQDLEELKIDAERLERQLLQSNSKDEALEVAIKAAETSMRALKLAKEPSEKSQLSTRVKRLLDEAERIKISTDWRQVVRSSSSTTSTGNGSIPTNVRVRTLKEPHSTRKLPNQEQILLYKASYLHGFKFPPWTTPPAPDEFELKEGEELFTYVSLTI